MTYLMALLVVLLTAFLAKRAVLGRKVSAPFGELLFFKLHYLAVGFFLAFFFPDNFVIHLDKIMGMILWFFLSWIGLYYGCSLEIRAHQKFSSKVILFNIFEPLFIFFSVVLAGTIFIYIKFADLKHLSTVILIALFCSFTIFRKHGILYREGDYSRHPILDDLLPVGNILVVIGSSLTGYFLFGMNEISLVGHTFTGIFPFSIFHVFLGLVTGIILNMLISASRADDSISIILSGGTAFAGGLAYALSFSPLFVGMVSGAFLINSTLKRLQILEILNDLHDLIEKLFMFFLGTMLSPIIISMIISGGSKLIFIIVISAILFTFRLLLKYIESSLLVSSYHTSSKSTSLLWIGLTGQGILAAGAALEYQRYIPHLPSIFLLFIILLILNQFAIGIYVMKTGRTRVPEGTRNA